MKECSDKHNKKHINSNSQYILMPRLSTLKVFLDRLYDTDTGSSLKTGAHTKKRKKDTKQKGIILRGKGYVKKIALCVNATNETIQLAIDSKADMLIAHNIEELDKTVAEKKFAILKDTRITLYVTGMSMDTLYVYGTDYILAKAIGLKSTQRLEKKTKRGLFGTSRISTYQMFQRRINWLTHEASEAYQNNKETIKKAAVCMGETPEEHILKIAVDNSCNTILCNTGNIALKTSAKDLNINLFIANYTATEKLTLLALKKIIDDKFTTKTVLLDEPDY